MKIKQNVKRVYVMFNPDNLNVKIGVSENPESRTKYIKMASGCDISLIYCTKPVYNYLEIEKKAHDNFKDKRRIGEWFDIDVEDAVCFVKNQNALDVCKVVELYDSGLNASKIAQRLDASRSGVIRYLKSIGYNYIENENCEKRKPCGSLSKEAIELMVLKQKSKKKR